jgi:hypothetical protein
MFYLAELLILEMKVTLTLTLTLTPTLTLTQMVSFWLREADARAVPVPVTHFFRFLLVPTLVP